MQDCVVDDLFSAACAAPSALPLSPVLYRPSAMREFVELASVHGSAVALPTHFHDEDQITFVISGRRRFRIGGGLVEVAPGQGAVIAAGTPHSSLDEPEGVVCFNAYLRAGGDVCGALVAAMTRRWHQKERLSLAELAEMLREHRQDPQWQDPERPIIAAAGTSVRLNCSVQGAAEGAGMSREGFSRAFRRIHGVAPSVFRSLTRLNQARLLLRAGAPLAAVAAETGFADQSHLGRCFRRAFGVTPGR